MNPQTQLFQDGSSPQQLSIDFIPDEEFVTVLNLSNDERGLFVSLRLFALTHGGLPENLEELWLQGKNCFGISRYKFFKLAPRVIEFKFENFSGRFYFSRDKERIEVSRDKISKSRSFGKLGAESRWKKRLAPVTEEPGEPIAPPSAVEIAPLCESAMPVRASAAVVVGSLSLLQEGVTTTTPSPLPPFLNGNSPPIATEAAASGHPQALTDAEYRQIQEHCRTVVGGGDRGVPIPDRKLCEKLRAKFSGIPIAEVVLFLPRFAGQKTPGLWLAKSVDELKAEAERQRKDTQEPYRKPVQKNKTEQMYERILHG